jgi:hypothetical protein
MVMSSRNINEVYLEMASNHRRMAINHMVDEGKLSSKMVKDLKLDIANLTNLKNTTEEEDRQVRHNINLINLILDDYYDELLNPTDKQVLFIPKDEMKKATLPVGASRKMPTSPKGRKLPTSR